MGDADAKEEATYKASENVAIAQAQRHWDMSAKDFEKKNKPHLPKTPWSKLSHKQKVTSMLKFTTWKVKKKIKDKELEKKAALEKESVKRIYKGQADKLREKENKQNQKRQEEERAWSNNKEHRKQEWGRTAHLHDIEVEKEYKLWGAKTYMSHVPKYDKNGHISG